VIDDTLTRTEKAALVLSMMGQILSIFLWYVGRDADLSVALPALKVVFGIAGAIALDLVVVTTTMGRRAGRQSWWGALTIVAAAVFSAAIALDAAGGPTLGAWNHISYPVVIVLFAQHLAAPKVDSRHQAVDATLTADRKWLVEPGVLAYYPDGIPLPVDAAPVEVVTTLTAPAPVALPLDIVQLHDNEGLSFADIGAQLGISRQAAQKRYEKARSEG
jgi:predicted DNA-binding protein (UPF0251 family)